MSSVVELIVVKLFMVFSPLQKGFDDTYGARPLRREIQNDIEDKLSEKILDGSIKNGDTVICDFKDGEFTFTKEN